MKTVCDLILANSTAVITGAGSGIGKSIVECYLDAGAKCFAAGLNEESLKALKEEFADYGGKLATMVVDVSDCRQVEAMVDNAVKDFGSMEIIVNNVGIMDNLLSIAEMDDDIWERIM